MSLASVGGSAKHLTCASVPRSLKSCFVSSLAADQIESICNSNIFLGLAGVSYAMTTVRRTPQSAQKLDFQRRQARELEIEVRVCVPACLSLPFILLRNGLLPFV